MGNGSTEDEIRRKAVLRRLYIASALCTSFIIVEVIGGVIANSLAILSDAAHLFSDLASFAVAIAASYLASLPATQGHTFGLKRTESLAALFSMVSLAFVSIALAYEAIRRVKEPPEDGVDGRVMSGVAFIGVLVNVVLALVLGEDHVHMPGAHDHSHEHHNGGGHSHSHEHSSCNENSDSHAHDTAAHSDSHHDHGTSHEHSSTSHDHGTSHDHSATEHGHHGHDHHHGHSETDQLLLSENSKKRIEVIQIEHDGEVPPPVADKRNVNLRAAYLHVMADLLQSIGVLIAGIVIWLKPEWHIIDPICTLLFCCVVFYSTIGVFKSSLSVLLEATPPDINWMAVYTAIKLVPDVTDVHDLHIWSISHGQPSLSVHCTSKSPQQAIQNINKVCAQHGISHTTIQVQTEEGSCATCPTDCCTSSLLV